VKQAGDFPIINLVPWQICNTSSVSVGSPVKPDGSEKAPNFHAQVSEEGVERGCEKRCQGRQPVGSVHLVRLWVDWKR
jgi:hypothetical protein